MMIDRHWVGLLALLLTACVGDVGGKDPTPGGGPDPGSASFACDTSAPPPAMPLRRLSKTQYKNLVTDLVRATLPSEADAIMGAAESKLDLFPSDKRTGPLGDYGAYTRLDQTVHQETVDASYAVATLVGAELTSTSERLAQVAGDCATNGDAADDDTCLDDFITRFGLRALRRPLDADDIAFYRAVAEAPPFDAPDYADVIGMLLMAPEALYFVEHGTSDDEVATLSPYELASRLSFHFWQTIPDEELLEAARTGALSTPEGYAAEVDRLLADPRTRDAVATFFSEWLHKEDLGELDSRVGTPLFDAFAAGFVPGPDLRERMFDETTDMGLYYALDTAGTFEDLFTSTESFAKTDDLATLYGVPVWDGTSAPPTFPDADRVGLIPRAAVVATGSANTRPIMKGVFVRKALLCLDIPPPPDNAAANPPELSATSTTREVVEQITEQPGTQCAGCHASLINPLGYATEGFDALGRSRSVQTLFDPDSGEVLGEKPVDTTSIPNIGGANETVTTGAADLTSLMMESGYPQACFVQQYFRFTFGRAENLEGDGCTLSTMHERVLAGDSLRDVLRQVALTDAFRTRVFD
ncbi:MAG: DUF1592 domain-containing protein [Polyangiaceae bacterium]|nr:DUF1592 domain-containing protein [Polyangiaceae bacterium]